MAQEGSTWSVVAVSTLVSSFHWSLPLLRGTGAPPDVPSPSPGTISRDLAKGFGASQLMKGLPEFVVEDVATFFCHFITRFPRKVLRTPPCDCLDCSACAPVGTLRCQLLCCILKRPPRGAGEGGGMIAGEKR